MDLKTARKIYMIGIKGVGMTAIAQVLKLRGKEVTGSDTHEKFFTDEVLAKSGIKFYEGFEAANLEKEKPDLVIYSTAYTEENPELAAARKSGLPILSYPEVLGQILKEGFGIAVCGTHGKTTTSAMLGFVLQELGADPTVIVGSAVPQLGGNARVGKGEYVVIEADEYQNKFLYFKPRAVVLTSAEYDHPDFFKTEADYFDAFRKFVAKIPAEGFLVACADDKNVKEISASVSCKIIFYGLTVGDWQAKKIVQKNGGMEFEVFGKDKSQGIFKIKLLGNHNVANALAVIATAAELGYGPSTSSENKLRGALENFSGAVRRFEIKGEVAGVIVVDDYGHHPTEIKVTLEAARQKYPDRRIWCVFHPHTFTRTKALLSDFSKSFGAADKTIVIDIYGSAREVAGGVSSEDLVELIKKEGKDALYIPTILEAAEFLAKEVKSGDVVITMGAGDVWRIGELLLEKLK
ncbi:UDP-N-acetylmuramate--L-alanine ligase [Candidatus Falkowbacteria bacterium]|nr:UDP-N-acetylmuramate--L-alanine ligase [Candidatus Falkowbacteria bacterium]